MTITPSWTAAELAALGSEHSLRLSAGTAGHPGVDLGMVVVDDQLYVRAYRGPGSQWFRAAVAEGRGRITVGAVERDVTFTRYAGPAEPLDAAYRAKYGDAPAREATLLVTAG